MHSTENSDRTTVWQIRNFDGARNERLYRIWDAVAEMLRDRMRLRLFSNFGSKLDHGECLQRIWEIERSEPNRRCILTEHDFLPSRDFFAEDLVGREGVAVAAVEYYSRVGGPKPVPGGMPGAWWIYIDKARLALERPVDLEDGGEFNDPAAKLEADVMISPEPGPRLYPYGLSYSMGTHLFWSRHLHDPPDMVVGREKMRLGDMQEAHDEFVEQWIERQPEQFQKAYRGLCTSA